MPFDPVYLPAIVTLLVGIVSSIAPVVSALASRRKGEGDLTRAITEAAMSMIGPLRHELDAAAEDLTAVRVELKRASAQIAEMQAQLDMRDAEVAELKRQLNATRATQATHERGIQLLNEQVKALGGQPVYRLPGLE